ncbi:hypothetical protein F5B19DRAFT_317651 [Rostrohypoxylon terebratum]|nr:hypothetical protein F5B19DRAFT_317651 [Rostrohypoxylon terebratum]
MPYMPEENNTGARHVAGNPGLASSRKRARTDSEFEAPRAKIAKTCQEDEKLEDLKSSLARAAGILDDAVTEIRETKADLKERKRRIKDLIAEFHEATTAIADRGLAYTASLREEKLKKKNASLRDRLKRLEEASVDDSKRETDQESRPRRRAKPYAASKPSVEDPDVDEKSIKQGE